MELLICIFLGVLGAAMGSFAAALAWRLREKKNFVSDRSECETCHHKLSAMDLIPIFGWIFLGGKCRYCHAKISQITLWIEIALAAIFAISFACWPLGAIDSALSIGLFAAWLILVTGFAVLTVYDLRWFLLPNKVVFPLIAIAAIFWGVYQFAIQHATPGEAFSQLLFAMLPIAGFYGIMYIVSRGRWVGLGDVKLGVVIGFILTWQQAVAVLILANVLGVVAILPLLAAKKLKRDSKIPFGPLLIFATIIVFLSGHFLINSVTDNLLLM